MLVLSCENFSLYGSTILVLVQVLLLVIVIVLVLVIALGVCMILGASYKLQYIGFVINCSLLLPVNSNCFFNVIITALDSFSSAQLVSNCIQWSHQCLLKFMQPQSEV